MTLDETSELIAAVHELFIEELVNHTVYSFGIVAGRGDSGWLITDQMTSDFFGEDLTVMETQDITYTHNVFKGPHPIEYQWFHVPTDDGRSRVGMTIHSNEVRMSCICGDVDKLDITDPQSLYRLLEIVTHGGVS